MSEKNKGIFYGVVTIVTLIVAIVGATLAYFSVFASSPNNAVELRSKIVNISYTDGQNIILSDELIPSAYNYVVKSYEEPIPGTRERCRDDHNVTDANGVSGYQICSVYEFNIENTADAVELEMYLKIGLNEFTNLKYMLYEVNGNSRTNIYSSLDSMASNTELSYPIGTREAGERVSLAGYDEDNNIVKYSMPANSSKTFELVMYLNETSIPGEDIAQDYEQGKSFAGTIEVKVGDNLTGYISD